MRHPETLVNEQATDPHAPATTTARRVWCIIPWHARALELHAVLADLGRLERSDDLAPDGPTRVDLRVIVVDNASSETFRLPASVPGLHFERLRLDDNRGGSGGFNAGIERALSEAGDDPDAALWLLDSDARPAPDALLRLLDVMDRRGDACAVGSALADPLTGRIYEVGGMLDRRTGALRPAHAGRAGVEESFVCDYAASCSVLVRADAVRAAGPMPDLFLHADDAAWFVRMRRATGRHVVAAPASIVHHPRFDRFATRARYYAARNGFAPMRELGLGRRAAARRAWREVLRAAQQELLGRRDLARLHVAGLHDAAEGPATGPGAGLAETIEPFRSLADLADALTPAAARLRGRTVRVPGARALGLTPEQFTPLLESLARAGLHVVETGRPTWRVVHAGARDAGHLRSPGLILVAPGVRGGGGEPGFVIRTDAPLGAALHAGGTALRAARAGVAVVRRWSPSLAPGPARSAPSGRPSLSIVIVSYNRWDALHATLTHLRSMSDTRDAELIVADNDSSDASAERVETQFPGVRVVRMGANRGVAAFNRGVEAATRDAVLVLDDDAWPESGAVGSALHLLSARPGIAAVSLHPRHPASGRSEWRAAAGVNGTLDDWPIMGCGNLVRRAAWLEVGGYEERFFLYRNDVDLALKLLAAGWGVHFNPAWTVWHNSPAASRKSERWHRTATRNWVWLARRHARGLPRAWGAVLGWAWAHRLAGLSLRRHIMTLRGVAEGICLAPPCSPGSVAPPRHAFSRLLRLLTRRS